MNFTSASITQFGQYNSEGQYFPTGRNIGMCVMAFLLHHTHSPMYGRHPFFSVGLHSAVCGNTWFVKSSLVAIAVDYRIVKRRVAGGNNGEALGF
jgi:hypothetical protein